MLTRILGSFLPGACCVGAGRAVASFMRYRKYGSFELKTTDTVEPLNFLTACLVGGLINLTFYGIYILGTVTYIHLTANFSLLDKHIKSPNESVESVLKTATKAAALGAVGSFLLNAIPLDN